MKNSTFGIVIVVLVILVASQRGCFHGSDEHRGPDTVRTVDTTWLKHDSIIIRKVPVIHEIEVPVASKPEYLADPEYPKLKAQYDALVRSHISKRVYIDSIKVGKWGHISITDTVQENKLLGRKYQENYKIPVVKETMTITKYPDPVRQVYIGGGVNATGLNMIKGAEAGILYKTKKDQIIGASFNVNVDGTTSFGIKYYTKIQLKRK